MSARQNYRKDAAGCTQQAPKAFCKPAAATCITQPSCSLNILRADGPWDGLDGREHMPQLCPASCSCCNVCNSGNAEVAEMLRTACCRMAAHWPTSQARRVLEASQWRLLGERPGCRVIVANPPRRHRFPAGVLHVTRSFAPCRLTREWPGLKLGSRRAGTQGGGRNKQGLMMTASARVLRTADRIGVSNRLTCTFLH